MSDRVIIHDEPSYEELEALAFLAGCLAGRGLDLNAITYASGVIRTLRNALEDRIGPDAFVAWVKRAEATSLAQIERLTAAAAASDPKTP